MKLKKVIFSSVENKFNELKISKLITRDFIILKFLKDVINILFYFRENQLIFQNTLNINNILFDVR